MERSEKNVVYLNPDTIIQPQAYSFLKRYASKLPPEDRLVTITFSEYKLLDVVPGDYKYDDQPPPNFIVIGVHFIKADRYQPIGTLFLYDESYAKGKTPSSKDLADCLRLYILAVAKIPLTVVSTVAPPSGTFKKALGNLIGVTDMASFDGPLVYSVFEVKNIVHFYDPPSLLRAFRNFFMHQDIEFKINETIFVASWKDITELFARDRLPSLTKEHVAPTIKISHPCYAISIFSNKVRNAVSNAVKSDILPLRAIGTSVLIKIFNDLFDSFNSCALDGSVPTRQLISTKSFHHSFWENTLKILASVFFMDKVYADSDFRGNECNNNVKGNFKYSDSQKAIADDPMGDICIKTEPSCKSRINGNVDNIHVVSKSIRIKSDNNIHVIGGNLLCEKLSMLHSNNANNTESVKNIHEEQIHYNIKNVNGKVDISIPEEKKQMKMSTLRMSFLDGLRNSSVVEFKEGKDIGKKSIPVISYTNSNENSGAHELMCLTDKSIAKNNDQVNNNVKTGSESPNEHNYVNGEASKDLCEEENEVSLKKFIAEFSKCNVKDCYGFFEDKDCDIEMEYMPLLEKGKDAKKRNKKKHYESVQRISPANSEESAPDNNINNVSTIKLAVNELKEIEHIVKNSEVVCDKSKKRTTKSNRKKVKCHKKDSQLKDSVNQMGDENYVNANDVNDKENAKRDRNNAHKTNSLYPLNNTLEKEKVFNQCIKKLNVFTENDTNSKKTINGKSHVEKTDVKSNNIKTNCDITDNLNQSTNNSKKKRVRTIPKVVGQCTFPTESERREALNVLLGMDIDEYCPGYSDLLRQGTQLVASSKVFNSIEYYEMKEDRPILQTRKPGTRSSDKTKDISTNDMLPNIGSYGDHKLNNGMKEMLELSEFESDSEPDMPSIPISDILEKLEASDKQPAKLKYIKHEITSNWMSNIQGMQLIVKRLRREGLKEFSSRVFNVDCTHSYVNHVRDANHRLLPNTAYFGKSIAKLLDPFHAVLAMSKGTAVLLP